ncbi:MAG: hypothetical protein CM1200mP29_12700 [Verrucomicrobiota bacterium]|nr:MAG: hypothetical protein CM1200mP29_12700 [Verrucomicrobiota bacterium]
MVRRRRLFSLARKQGVQNARPCLLSRYRSYTCARRARDSVQPDSLRFKLDYTGSGDWLTLSDFYRLPIRDAAG